MSSSDVIVISENGGKSSDLLPLLARCGYPGRPVAKVAEAVHAFDSGEAKLAVLATDGTAGAATCRDLRAAGDQPIVAICPEATAEDVVITLLRAGADIVLSGQVSRRELSARLDALSRRPAELPRENGHRDVYNYQDLRVEMEPRTAHLNGRLLPLTATEFRLLVALVRRSGAVVTHEDLSDEVWGDGAPERRRKLRLYVRTLRRKLSQGQQEPMFVWSRRGVGYGLTRSTTAGKDQVQAYG